MRRSVFLLAGVALVAGITTMAIASQDSEIDSVPDAETKAELAVATASLVGGNTRLGSDFATTAEVVATTRGTAASLYSPGTELSTDQPVYFVKVEGDFVGYLAKVPAGVKPPTGDFLFLVYDPATNLTLDWGIGESEEHELSLEKLGSVTSVQVDVETAEDVAGTLDQDA